MIEQKLLQLTELMNDPGRNAGSVLFILYDIFQITHQCRDLPPVTTEWLSGTARAFLSPDLLKVFMKLRLEIYAFHFAALNFLDIDDVIDDLSNDKLLKVIQFFPPGAFNKLKRELLGPVYQQNSLNESIMKSASTASFGITPTGTVTGTKSSMSSAPPQAVIPPAPSAFSRMGNRDSTDATTASPILPNINDAYSETEALRRAAANVGSGMLAPNAYQIIMPTQTTLSESPNVTMTAPVQQNPTSGLLANIREPQYSSVSASVGSAKKDKCLIKTPVRDRNTSTSSDGSYAPEEEIYSYPDFKPIIPLPQLVEVKTGEEGEDVLFDQRCKLFRLVEGEWKERGFGQLKILRDQSTNKVRLLMRRDKVLKICANHAIAAATMLSEMKAPKNSWIWAAMDFADGEKGNLEKFAVRFRTEEQSIEFRKVFEGAQAPAPKTPEKAATVSSQQPPVQQGYVNQFAPKSGTWSCNSCYVNNNTEAVNCVSCDTPKPGAAINASSASTAPLKKFGIPTTSTQAGTPTKYGTPSTISTSTAPSIGLSLGIAHEAVTSIKFGMSSVPTAAVNTTKPSFGSVSNASSGSLYGLPAAKPGGFSFPSTTFSAPAIASSTTKYFECFSPSIPYLS